MSCLCDLTVKKHVQGMKGAKLSTVHIEKWIYARQQHKEHCMVERMSAFICSDSDANTSFPGHEKASSFCTIALNIVSQ